MAMHLDHIRAIRQQAPFDREASVLVDYRQTVMQLPAD